MEAFIRYILIATFCLSFLYLGYLIFLKRETRFNQLRYFLLFSIVLSLLLPLSTYQIDIKLPANNYKVEELNSKPETTTSLREEVVVNPLKATPENKSNGSIANLIIAIYFTGLLFFSLRLLAHLIKILNLFWTSEKVKHENIVLLSSKAESPFNFFNWVFIPNNLLKDENKDIITHERIHASQYHSIDVILIELLSAVMWFNPLVWMMKNSVQLVHEYLADEGVLNTGTDRLRYQALLINQVAEESLICLSSGFNHSLIKKRMIMMTKSRFNQSSKLRILVLIPLATVLFIAVACVKGKDKSGVVAVEMVKMNVLYIGVDNPIKIAASGYDASDLSVTIDNGTILGQNGEYIIRPKEQGPAIVTVSSNGKEIQKSTFRVKALPDPEAYIQIGDTYYGSGPISKKELLNSKGIITIIRNFNFDVNFEVQSFSLVTSLPEPGPNSNAYEMTSNSENFSPDQIHMINSLVEDQRITVESITVKGPDGELIKLSPLVFKIKK